MREMKVLTMMRGGRGLVLASIELTLLLGHGLSPPWPVSGAWTRGMRCTRERYLPAEQTGTGILCLSLPDHCCFRFRCDDTSLVVETRGCQITRMVPQTQTLISCQGLAPGPACCVCWSLLSSWEQFSRGSDGVFGQQMPAEVEYSRSFYENS